MAMKALRSQLPAHAIDASERYSRTANTRLPRRSLGNMSFLVVGGGALGNEVLKNLGLLGAGEVILVDPDRIEISNLARSVFFRAGDCGQPKVEILSASLTSIFPDTRWKPHPCEIADLGYGELAGVSLILSCVDSDLARIEAAFLAMGLNIPMVDAGLGGPDYWRGRVSFFAGKHSACFCCKLSPRRRRELLSLALSKGHSCWQKYEPIPLPSTPTMAAITGGLQVDFGLQCLADFGHGDRDGFKSPTIEISLDSVPRLRRFVTAISPGCPFHHAVPQLYVAPPQLRASTRELLDAQNAHIIELDWPICVSARCLECRFEWQPKKRVAWLRRQGLCSLCGSHRILEKETISSLDRNSRWVDTPLVELGLPERHLYAVRMKNEKGRLG